MRPTRLLDPADRLRVEATVFEAEQETAGEIVVVVVGASDAYASAGWRLGLLLALLAFLGAASFAPGLPPLALLLAQVLGLGLGHALARLDPVRRRLVSDAVAETRTRERALRAFAENGLSRTRGRTGVLLFVSLLEHRVLVMADTGVDRVLDPDDSWQEVVDLAVAGLREGHPAEGLVRALERLGRILHARLPAPSRNPDELPTALVLED
jgi:putative membrane protein